MRTNSIRPRHGGESERKQGRSGLTVVKVAAAAYAGSSQVVDACEGVAESSAAGRVLYKTHAVSLRAAPLAALCPSPCRQTLAVHCARRSLRVSRPSLDAVPIRRLRATPSVQNCRRACSFKPPHRPTPTVEATLSLTTARSRLTIAAQLRACRHSRCRRCGCRRRAARHIVWQ